MSFMKNLIFRTDSRTITSPVTIMLAFDAIPATPPVIQVAWRVLNFGGGSQVAQVTYAENLVVASLEIQAGNLVTAAANVVLSPGQQTTLTDEAGVGVFTPPVTGLPGQLIATNNTGQTQELGIGFLNPNSQLPDVLLAWQNVQDNLSVSATYTPILKVYVTSGYQQNELITGEIVIPVILTVNLESLPESQTYTLVSNSVGELSLIPDAFATPAPGRRLIGYEPAPNDYHCGKPGFIGVINQSRFNIWVKVSKSSNPSGKDDFYKVAPGKTETWARSRPEVVSVNVKGHGLVTDYFGAVGRNLQIKG